MEVIWTRLANITYKEVFENLEWRWTKKEMKNFRDLTNEMLDKIKNEQVLYPFANEKLGVRKGKVHKNVSLFYKVYRKNNKIYLITFFNNRMNPKVLKFISIWLLFAHLLDMFWLIMPNMRSMKSGYVFSWIDLVFPIAGTGLVILVFVFAAKKTNLIPIGDPKLKRGSQLIQ